MKIIVGQNVRGDNFFDRENELREIWDSINNGSHILLSAPRRVGKTSIMYKIQDKPQDDFIVLYVDVESADDKNEFWHKVFNKLSSSIKPNISDDIIRYILDKIEWLIPFYIQLVIDSIKYESIIDKSTIDKAINDVIEHRNYFESWESKIRANFKGDKLKWTKDVLNKISINETIDTLDIQNLSDKYNLNDDDNYKDILRTLVYDGYINNEDDIKVYRFTSPILRLWWFKNVAN